MPDVRFVFEADKADVHYSMDIPPRVGEFVRLSEFTPDVLEVAHVVWSIVPQTWHQVTVRLITVDRGAWDTDLDARIETHL